MLFWDSLEKESFRLAPAGVATVSMLFRDLLDKEPCAMVGSVVHVNAIRLLLLLDWMSFGIQRLHATTKTSETSAVVQRPMNRLLYDTSVSDMTAVILPVYTIRIADAMHALLCYLARYLARCRFEYLQ